MLTIFDSHPRLGRRDFLRLGTLALGGLSLPSLLAAQSASQSSPSRPVTDRSVIFLFLHGGPSQTETFDPKMTAPAGTRSATGEIKTALPGVTFGSSFPRMAKLADKLAIVRSYVPGDANHDIKPVMGKATFGANLGCVYSQVAGANDPETGMPTNAALFPKAVDTRAQGPQFGFGRFDAVGPFNASTVPFMPGAGGNLQKDMTLALSRERLGDRRTLMRAFDGVKSSLDASADALDSTQRKAFEVILKGVGDAFDLSKEDAKTVGKYDTEPLVPAAGFDKKWNNHKNYLDNARSLGKLLLLARRLCERGCGFVTVTTNFVWDMHADVNNATMTEGMGYMAPPLDHAVSAFVEDLEARGLSEKILLVVCGEMGRTPRINGKGGRDHWGNIGPLLFAGGGLKMGQVIGCSDKNAGEPACEAVRPTNVIATVLNTLLDVGKVRVVRGMPRELLTMTEYAPIPALV